MNRRQRFRGKYKLVSSVLYRTIGFGASQCQWRAELQVKKIKLKLRRIKTELRRINLKLYD